MNIHDAIALVRSVWDEQGACASCGWHAALHEYDPIGEGMRINEDKQRIELQCMSDDEDRMSHRGVRIYFTQRRSAE